MTVPPTFGFDIIVGSSTRCPRESCCQNAVPPPVNCEFGVDNGINIVNDCESLCGKNCPSFVAKILSYLRRQHAKSNAYR